MRVGQYVLFRTGFVTGAPAEALFSVVLDTDGDSDGVLDSGDCDNTNDQVWSLPGEVTDLILTPSSRSPDETVIEWTPPADLGGVQVEYELLRTEAVAAFDSSGEITCVLEGSQSTTTQDSDVPGSVFYYLARAVNACGNGVSGENRSAADAAVCDSGP